MTVELVAAIAGLTGLVTGAAAMLAVRVNDGIRTRHDVPEPPHRLPPGVASVLSVLPSSAVVVDNDDVVLRASSAARAFGLVKGDRLVASDLLALARQVRRDGEIRETEIDVPSKKFGGRITSFAVRVAPLGAPFAGAGLVLVLAEDQTESRRVEAVRRDFVANVSHELKTPVGALALLAETVEEAADDPDAVRKFSGRMRQEAVRLTKIVQDLLTLTRVQTSEPVADPQPVDLDSVITEAIDRCQLKAGARSITLTSGGDHGLTVVGDEDMLVIALRNLIENAIAYSPEHTRVAVSATRATKKKAEVSVADQGIGIPEADLERIFERFYRVDPARSRATGGTGLGLAIVKHVTAAHGGKVTVWSKESAGSTFTLRLQLLQEPALGSEAVADGDTAGDRGAVADGDTAGDRGAVSDGDTAGDGGAVSDGDEPADRVPQPWQEAVK